MKTSYAEFSLDRIILDTMFPGKTDGVMVEVGAAGDVLSMSKVFREAGWRTICIEPIPEFAQQLRDAGVEVYEVAISNFENPAQDFFVVRQTPEYFPITCESASALEVRQLRTGIVEPPIKVKVTTMDKLLRKIKCDHVDFVCIDVEGFEMEVMQGFNTNLIKPSVIVLENFLNNPIYQEYMMAKGYALQSAHSYNQVYTRI